MNYKKSCVAVAIAVITGACSAPADIGNGPKTVTLDGDVQTMSSEHSPIADLAVQTLAEEMNIPISNIEVDTVRTIEWRDGSIGCPEPGVAYAQVITPGHKITLRVDGQLHFVHEANGRAAVCRQAKINPGQLPQVDLVWGKMALVARADLAVKLGVEERHVLVSGGESQSWDSSALGCEEPGVEYESGVYEGFVLYLRHGSRRYTYHTDMERVFACPAITED
jgi:hypothetical protein